LQFFSKSTLDFAIIAAPLSKVTRKDSGYKNGPLPPDTMHTFKVLQQQLMSELVMVFPHSETHYALITEVTTGTADSSSSLGAILTQIDDQGNHFAISFASRQLKDHEQNYSPFLLEAAAAVWGMEVFKEYLRGKQFILFTDHKPLEKLGHLHTKKTKSFANSSTRAQFHC
jgi:hypothetical protein